MDDFSAACDHVRENEPPRRLAPGEALSLFALFKVARGEAPEKPGMADLDGRAKYEAWQAKKDMRQADAQLAYVRSVERIYGISFGLASAAAEESYMGDDLHEVAGGTAEGAASPAAGPAAAAEEPDESAAQDWLVDGGAIERLRSTTAVYASEVADKANRGLQEAAGKATRGIQEVAGKVDVLLADIGARIGAKFAPVDIPLARRRQTFAVVMMLYFMPSLTLSLNLLLIRCGPALLLPYLLYAGWVLFVDEAHHRGGRPVRWLKGAIWWHWFRDYFPISIERTSLTPLDPSKKYIFGYHPHGIISVGAICNFATLATGFEEAFPGIDLHVLTLASNFRIPFFRDWLLAHGICDASKKTIATVLRQGPGKAVLLVIGGAKESLSARPGTYDLTLADRKGFVKMALRTGASLVPVFSFGENDLFDQVSNAKGSWLRAAQLRLQAKLGFAVPLFHGRGIFSYDSGTGLLPFRQPIVSVVGEPIDCPNLGPEPPPDQIDHYHALYCAALKDIWDQNKETHAIHRKTSLQFFNAKAT